MLVCPISQPNILRHIPHLCLMYYIPCTPSRAALLQSPLLDRARAGKRAGSAVTVHPRQTGHTRKSEEARDAMEEEVKVELRYLLSSEQVRPDAYSSGNSSSSSPSILTLLSYTDHNECKRLFLQNDGCSVVAPTNIINPDCIYGMIIA